jgi:hypothetical protein
MRLVSVLFAAVALCSAGEPAQSRTLQISGTAGYLAEWELTGAVSEALAGAGEFAGPLVWKHVGLCTVNGPEEKPGEIRFRIAKSGSQAHIDATIKLAGTVCTYRGNFSSSTTGRMDCSNAKGIPLSLSIK